MGSANFFGKPVGCLLITNWKVSFFIVYIKWQVYCIRKRQIQFEQIRDHRNMDSRLPFETPDGVIQRRMYAFPDEW